MEPMDPNATLTTIRRLSEDILTDDGASLMTVEALDLAYNVAALDEWLSRGAFLPDAWVENRP